MTARSSLRSWLSSVPKHVWVLALVVAVACATVAGTWSPRGMSDGWKIGCTAAAMALVIAGRWRHRMPPLARSSLFAALTVVLFLSAFAENQHRFRGFVQGRYIQTWNVFHHYMGSKYFAELGYYDLYAQLLRADDEVDIGLRDIVQARDLHTYDLRPRSVITAQADPDAFTPERWREFQGDASLFVDHASDRLFARMMTDHGYNATPFANTFYSWLSNTFSIRDPVARALPLGLDTLLVVASIALVAWAFGPWSALVFGSFFVLFYGVQTYQVAGFVRFDWFFATTAAVCLWRRDRPRLAGVALGYAAMGRIFPAFLLAVPALQLLRTWRETRVWDRDLVRLAAAFTLTCVVAVPVGAMNARGLESWGQFVSNIRQHGTQHYLGPQRLGLKQTFTYDFDAWEVPRSKARRSEAYASHRGWHYATVSLFLGMFAVAAWGLRRREHMVLGMSLSFILLVLSRYYWALWGLFALLCVSEECRGWRGALLDLGVWSFGLFFFVVRSQGSPPVNQLQISNTYMLLFFVGLLGGLAARTLRQAQREPPADHSNTGR